MSESSNPTDLRYHAEHVWARVDGDTAVLGITAYASDQLGEVIFFDPPKVGAKATRGVAFAQLESVKAVSDVIAPLSGEVLEVNAALSGAPETVNQDPYQAGWLAKLRLSDPPELDGLLDSSAYAELLARD